MNQPRGLTKLREALDAYENGILPRNQVVRLLVIVFGLDERRANQLIERQDEPNKDQKPD